MNLQNASEKIDRMIDENIRRAYKHKTQEPVPQRMQDLIDLLATKLPSENKK